MLASSMHCFSGIAEGTAALSSLVCARLHGAASITTATLALKSLLCCGTSVFFAVSVAMVYSIRAQAPLATPALNASLDGAAALFSSQHLFSPPCLLCRRMLRFATQRTCSLAPPDAQSPNMLAECRLRRTRSRQQQTAAQATTQRPARFGELPVALPWRLGPWPYQPGLNLRAKARGLALVRSDFGPLSGPRVRGKCARRHVASTSQKKDLPTKQSYSFSSILIARSCWPWLHEHWPWHLQPICEHLRMAQTTGTCKWEKGPIDCDCFCARSV